MKLDLNLLKRLLEINHPSKDEWPMITFIINECYKIGDLEFQIDDYANVFITKNTTNPNLFPCIVAHMDCVPSCTTKHIKIKNNKITGINSITGKQVGMGADDANGICVALQLLKTVPNLKVCFTTEEEIGFNGAYCAADNVDFFYNVSYMIQADRHGSSDLITHTNGINVTSDEWLDCAMPIMLKYNYKEAIGIGTDIGVLSEKLQLSSVNISCGYYSEHTDKERIVISELQNCLNFIEEILNTISADKQYEIKVEYFPYTNSYKDYYRHNKDYYLHDYPSDGYSDPYNLYDDDLPCDHCVDMDCMHCTKQF